MKAQRVIVVCNKNPGEWRYENPDDSCYFAESLDPDADYDSGENVVTTPCPRCGGKMHIKRYIKEDDGKIVIKTYGFTS